MANHGYIQVKKKIISHDIDSILVELDQRVFKGNLVVDSKVSNSENFNNWPFWVVGYYSTVPENMTEAVEGDSFAWASRSFWMNNHHSFEMRHGGGGGFGWWVDAVIMNEVAVRFDGIISDDGIDDEWHGVPYKYDNYLRFLVRLHTFHMSRRDKQLRRRWMMQQEMELTPPEFRADLGPKIQFKVI